MTKAAFDKITEGLAEVLEIVRDEPKNQTNSSFSPTIPGLQLAWDSTSLDAFDKCPRLYQYTIIEGWRPAGALNAHLHFGSVLHSATELYSKERAVGADHDAALCSALQHALEATWDPTLRRPWASEESTKTRNTLLRTIVWYLDRFRDDSLQTLILANGKPAVELSFRFDSGIRSKIGDEQVCSACEGTGIIWDEDGHAQSDCNKCDGTGRVGSPYLICGHLDRVVVWNEDLWITDKKTTKNALDDYYFRAFNPSNQMEIYSVAGMITLDTQIRGLIIDGMQILVEGSRFRRQTIEFSEPTLEEFLSDLQIKIREAETYAAAGHWPMRRTSCGYGRFQCAFRGVCSADPAIRPTLLQTGFERRIWDPLQPR